MKGMKNAFLNNNDMSQYDQDIIDQALGFLKEDNKRFVKIVTAKKNVVAAESDIKIISDNKFYPVQYWLDTVTNENHKKVLYALRYSTLVYSNWWDLTFSLYISSRPSLGILFNETIPELGFSIKKFGKELVDKTDREPFYDPDKHAAVDQVMNQLLDKIYLDIDKSSSVPLYPSTIPPISSELDPPVADVTTMEPVKEIDGFVKGKETLVNACTQKMESLKPSDKIIFFGSDTFNFNTWWTSLLKRYSGTEVEKILNQHILLYAPPEDLKEGEQVSFDRPLYVPSGKGKITNPRISSSTSTPAPSSPPTVPPTSTAFPIRKFIKIAKELEKSFDDKFDEILDDFLKAEFGDIPEDSDEVIEEVSTIDEKTPTPKKSNIFEIFKKSLQRKPGEDVDIINKSGNTLLKLYDFGFDSKIESSSYFIPEQKDVIVDGKQFIKLINQLLNAILSVENQKKKQQVDSANNLADNLQKTMDLTSAFYKGLGGSNLPTYTPRSRGKF